MSREEVLKKLREIFVDVFDDESIEIEESTSSDDIEDWDSLATINLLAAVQDEFDVSFEIDEMATMKTAGMIIDAVLGKLK